MNDDANTADRVGVIYATRELELVKTIARLEQQIGRLQTEIDRLKADRRKEESK